MSIVEQIVDAAVNYVLLPVILILLGAILGAIAKIITRTIEKWSKTKDSELANDLAEVGVNALKQLRVVVDGAVASNMTLSEKYKMAAEDGKLTDEEIEELKKIAHELIGKSIPIPLTDGTLEKIVGGPESIANIITGMIESSLIECKAKIIKK